MTELRSEVVAEADQRVDSLSEKAKRREARAMVGAYHEEQLRALLEHVREAFAQLDARTPTPQRPPHEPSLTDVSWTRSGEGVAEAGGALPPRPLTQSEQGSEQGLRRAPPTGFEPVPPP